jgi:hypothetical protein
LNAATPRVNFQGYYYSTGAAVMLEEFELPSGFDAFRHNAQLENAGIF